MVNRQMIEQSDGFITNFDNTSTLSLKFIFTKHMCIFQKKNIEN